MVDALHAAQRAVKRGGFVVDARPDASRRPRIVARGRVRARLVQCPDADQRDASADAAVARLLREGAFRAVRSGHLWHTARFADLRSLDAYLHDSARHCGYERGARRALLPFRASPLVMRRAVKFEVLERA